jgi:enoyl-CoA hydratase
MIKKEDWDSISLLRLEDGKVNALDLELCEALTESLIELERSSAKAVVLTGTGTTFSAGVDLFRLLDGGQDYVLKFVPALTGLLERLFLFPKPVVVALNGNAIAGGCVIACACDYKIAANGEGKTGVPEVLVGVPFPPSAFEIVRFAASPRYLQEIVYFGRYYDMEEGIQRGLVDETVSAPNLLSRATEIATKLSEIPADTFRLVKRQLREPYLATVERSKIRDEEILKVWCSEETHATIREYLRRTLGK